MNVVLLASRASCSDPRVEPPSQLLELRVDVLA